MAEDKDKKPVLIPDDVLMAMVDVTIGKPMENSTKPIQYVLTGTGLYMTRKNSIFGVTRRVMDPPKDTKLPIPGAAEMREGFSLNVPKIPWKIYESIIAFFRWVNDKRYNCEAYAQVWWSVERKEYYVVVPEQYVTKGSVNHQGDHDLQGNDLHVLDIHSHNTMAAFFSGVDDADERRFDRVFAVVGKIDQKIPATKWRIRVNHEFLELRMSAIIDAPSITYRIPVNMAEVCGNPDGSQHGTVEIKCSFDPFKEATFPDEWTTQLKEPVHHMGRGSGQGAGPSFLTRDDLGLGKDDEDRFRGGAGGYRGYGHSGWPHSGPSQQPRSGNSSPAANGGAGVVSRPLTKAERRQLRREERAARQGNGGGAAGLYYYRNGTCYRKDPVTGKEEEIPNDSLGMDFYNRPENRVD